MTRRTTPLPPDWPRTRRRILRRDNWTCRWKSERCIGHATEVDHVIPGHLDGSDEDDNLAAICEPCHLLKTAREARATQPNRTRPTEEHPGLLHNHARGGG